MKTINVFEYSSGQFLGKGFLSDEAFSEYEDSLVENPTGAVKLEDWMDEEERENVTAQDDATVYFEAVELASAE